MWVRQPLGGPDLLTEPEGQSQSVKRVIEPGWSAYSDFDVARRGTILCFYGRSDQPHFAGDRLTMARFNLKWLLRGD